MNLSADGLHFIERFEAFRSHLYNDAAGHATIGYGHLVHLGRVGSRPELETAFLAGISQAAAVVLLAKDTLRFQAAVRTWCRQNLQQHEFDALVSFAYNVGAAALKTSTLCRRVNSVATPDAITSAFEMWSKAGGQELPGLLRRRRAEAELYNTGNYRAGV